MYPEEATSACHSSQHCPRFVRLRVPPRAATLPRRSHLHSWAAGKAGGAPTLTGGRHAAWRPSSSHRPESAGLCAASHGAVLDRRRGVDRQAGWSRAPSGDGVLSTVSNTRPIVLASCGLLNTRHDTPRPAPSDKAGAEGNRTQQIPNAHRTRSEPELRATLFIASYG